VYVTRFFLWISLAPLKWVFLLCCLSPSVCSEALLVASAVKHAHQEEGHAQRFENQPLTARCGGGGIFIHIWWFQQSIERSDLLPSTPPLTHFMTMISSCCSLCLDRPPELLFVCLVMWYPLHPAPHPGVNPFLIPNNSASCEATI
jgi:hypothetical protein